MRAVVASLVFAAAVILAGCGGSAAQTSPFAGTWRMDSGDHPRWVIAAQDGRFSVVQGTQGSGSYLKIAELEPSGDKLAGRILVTSGVEGDAHLSIDDSGGQITLVVDGSTLQSPIKTTLSRVSDSTATPTPVP
jgi:hypothetical protein